MRILLTLVLSLYTFTLHAQGFEYFNTDDFWGRFVVDEKLQTTHPDSAFVMISNRKPTGDKLRFAGDDVDEQQLHYYYIYGYKDKWHVLETPSIEAAVKHMPNINNDWLLYTEGMGKQFTSDAYRAFIVTGMYKVNVMMFDYPSITSAKGQFGNYFFAIGNAKHAYEYFTPAIYQVEELRTQQKMGKGKLSMIFHSMGNFVIRNIAKKGDIRMLNDKVWVDNLILNAPCVPNRHHKEWIEKIGFAKNIYIHYNPADRTLGGAYLASKIIQLGGALKHAETNRAQYINFNILCGDGHSNFLNIQGRSNAKPAAVKHYKTLFHGDTVNLTNTNRYAPTQYRDIGYDILP